LEESRRRIADLARLADHDLLSGLLTRQSFVGELTGILSSSVDLPEAGALVFIKIANLEDLNARLGYASGDLAVAHVGTVLQNHLGAADIAGRLGGAAFCYTLIGLDRELVETRTEQLVEALSTMPNAEQVAEIAPEIYCNVYSLRSNEDAEDAIKAVAGGLDQSPIEDRGEPS
jgi:diguanylate cyclase (GGDEF)-like protein